ncbi:MAG: hypothetical protein ABIJ18_04635 [archaeon]
MDVCVSINSNVGDSFTKNNYYYGSSSQLADEFLNRGHNLTIVHPQDLIMLPGGLHTKKFLKKVDGELIATRGGYVRPEVFFIRSLGENSEDPRKAAHNLLSRLSYLEEQGILVLNSTESTQYEDKVTQKNIQAPFIPNFSIESIGELEALVRDEKEGIIAKPIVSFRRIGVVYLSSSEDVKAYFKSDDKVRDYVFERFIPDQLERRFIFLNGEIIATREVRLKGLPGKEVSDVVDCCMDLTSSDKKIVQSVIEQTGMFYGCVDFRGDYVLEINGSGTGTLCTSFDGLREYALENQIVKAVEEKVYGK